MALSHESANPVTPALAPGSASSTIIPLPAVSPGLHETPFFSAEAKALSASAGPSRPRSPSAMTEAEQARQARQSADQKQAKRPFPPHMHASPSNGSGDHGGAHSGDKEHVAEGTRTPRPKMLTPSPPGSRRSSQDVARGGVAAVTQGRKEGESDLAVLMRTIAFAAEVSATSGALRIDFYDVSGTLTDRRSTRVSAERTWTRHLSELSTRFEHQWPKD